MHFVHREHRAGGHAGFLQHRHPVPGGPGAEALAQNPIERRQVLHARGRVGEARVLGERLQVEDVEQPAPVGLVGGAERDPAVGGLERLIGRIERMGRAERARRLTRSEGEGRLPVGHDDAGLEQGGVDPLAATARVPLIEGRQHADGTEQAGDDVGHGRAALQRRPVGALAGDAHEAAHGLGHQVEAAAIAPRAGEAVAGDRAIDQAWIALFQPGLSEAEARQHAGPVVLDEHVGPGEQAVQHRLAMRRLEVEGERVLVAVDGHETGGLIADPVLGHRVVAGGLAARRPLDLDHLGAQVGQHQPAGGRGENVRQLDHPDAREGPVVGFGVG